MLHLEYQGSTALVDVMIVLPSFKDTTSPWSPLLRTICYGAFRNTSPLKMSTRCRRRNSHSQPMSFTKSQANWERRWRKSSLATGSLLAPQARNDQPQPTSRLSLLFFIGYGQRPALFFYLQDLYVHVPCTCRCSLRTPVLLCLVL